MDQDLNDYSPLCDMAECPHPRCGTPFEGFVRSRMSTIELPVRIHPCRIHLEQLRRLAYER